MYTIAYHGDGATPNRLAKDIGPNIKIDHYWHNLDKEDALNWIIDHANQGPFNLIGYSRGGYIITHITQYHPELINSAILYETPTLEYTQAPGTYPILLIWNTKGRQNTREGIKTEEIWRKTHPTTTLTGKRHHIRINPTPPFLRHNWDQSLNPHIHKWLNEINKTK